MLRIYLVIQFLFLFSINVEAGRCQFVNGSLQCPEGSEQQTSTNDSQILPIEEKKIPTRTEIPQVQALNAKQKYRYEQCMESGDNYGVQKCIDWAQGIDGKEYGSGDTLGDSSADCEKAYQTAAKQCKGAQYAQFAPAILNVAASIKAAKANGNMKKACEDAQKIQKISGVSNAAVAGLCQTGISRCKKACGGKDSVEAERCSEFEAYSQTAAMQAVLSANDMVASQGCIDAVAGNCTGYEAYNNSDCQQFCLKPQNFNHEKCQQKLTLNNCSNVEFAAQNKQLCACYINPMAPECRGTNAGGGSPVPGSTPNAGVPDFSDGGGGGEYDFDGAKVDPSQSKIASPADGGGGFSGNGSGGSYAFGENGGQGTGDEPINKDVLGGTGGGSGGSIFSGGGGYGEGSLGGGRGGGGGGEDKGLDLRAFLPGGKKDPTRNPASAGYDDPTITKANGLTNFQKVTRKMNEKRPELMP